MAALCACFGTAWAAPPPVGLPRFHQRSCELPEQLRPRDPLSGSRSAAYSGASTSGYFAPLADSASRNQQRRVTPRGLSGAHDTRKPLNVFGALIPHGSLVGHGTLVLDGSRGAPIGPATRRLARCQPANDDATGRRLARNSRSTPDAFESVLSLSDLCHRATRVSYLFCST
jgi:hypothetical protein